MTQKLILLRGVSGSGKSSLASYLSQISYDVMHVEADAFMYKEGEYCFQPEKLPYVHERCQLVTREFLSSGYDVIVSNTSTTEKEVAIYQQIAQEAGVEFISLVVERRHDGVNRHGVPDDKLHQQAQRLRSSLKL